MLQAAENMHTLNSGEDQSRIQPSVCQFWQVPNKFPNFACEPVPRQNSQLHVNTLGRCAGPVYSSHSDVIEANY